MAEYICREALIKELEADFNTDWADYASKNNFDKDYIDGVRDEYDDTLRIICQQKTADVQSVRHGRWTDHHCKHIEQLNANLIQAKCTYCGRYSDKIDTYCRYLDLEYCSHCGARIDLKED